MADSQYFDAVLSDKRDYWTLAVDNLLEDERNLVFPNFNADAAHTLGEIIRKGFFAQGSFNTKGIIISISLFTGLPLYTSVVGDDSQVTPDNVLWVEAKKNVVKRYGHSSFYMGRSIAASGKTPEAKGLVFPEYACHGGAFPIRLKGSSFPIGAIIVSGLAQDDDHRLVVESIAKYLQIHS